MLLNNKTTLLLPFTIGATVNFMLGVIPVFSLSSTTLVPVPSKLFQLGTYP